MPLLDLFWTMFMFFIFIMWFYLLISILMDIFRSEDLSGGVKALWVIFVVIVPFLGVLVYIIVRGSSMQERAAAQLKAQAKAQQDYIKDVAGDQSQSTADQIAKLAELNKSGALTDAEFQSEKAKLLA